MSEVDYRQIIRELPELAAQLARGDHRDNQGRECGGDGRMIESQKISLNVRVTAESMARDSAWEDLHHAALESIRHAVERRHGPANIEREDIYCLRHDVDPDTDEQTVEFIWAPDPTGGVILVGDDGTQTFAMEREAGGYPPRRVCVETIRPVDAAWFEDTAVEVKTGARWYRREGIDTKLGKFVYYQERNHDSVVA